MVKQRASGKKGGKGRNGVPLGKSCEGSVPEAVLDVVQTYRIVDSPIARMTYGRIPQRHGNTETQREERGRTETPNSKLPTPSPYFCSQ
jgi:hypothetical protein